MTETNVKQVTVNNLQNVLGKNKKGVCGLCGKEKDLHFIRLLTTLRVGGLEIKYPPYENYICDDCCKILDDM